jgi:hypothetical protein
MVVLVLGLCLRDEAGREHSMLPTVNCPGRSMELSYVPSALRARGWHIAVTVWLEGDREPVAPAVEQAAARVFADVPPLVKVRHAALGGGKPFPTAGAEHGERDSSSVPPLYSLLVCESRFQRVKGMLGGGYWLALAPLHGLPAHGMFCICAGMELVACGVASRKLLAFSGAIALDAHTEPTGMIIQSHMATLPEPDLARLAELPVVETQDMGAGTRVLWFQGPEQALCALASLAVYLHCNYGRPTDPFTSAEACLPSFVAALLPSTPVFGRFLPDARLRPVRCASFCDKVHRRPFAFEDVPWSHEDLLRWDTLPDVPDEPDAAAGVSLSRARRRSLVAAWQP